MIFNIELIENVIIDFVKIEKINEYLKDFLPSEVNCEETLLS
jgi:hypothetical protein